MNTMQSRLKTMPIKIAHEAMNCIRPLVDQLTDYDYYLVHLLDENQDYRVKAVNGTRESILDNSIFELGEAYNLFEYLEWITRLRPTYAIVPDSLDSKEETLRLKEEFFNSIDVSVVPTKYIAVAQGQTSQELMECYIDLENDDRISMIGISFNSKPFELDYVVAGISYPQRYGPLVNRAYARNRASFLDYITSTGTKKTKKPLHLLGVALPQEMIHYRDYYRDGIINSVDTSSPVIHGYYRTRYTEDGLQDKIPKKLHELIDVESLSRDQIIDITHNICMFRSFTRK